MTRRPHSVELGIGRASVVFGNLAGEGDGRIGLRFRRRAAAVQCNLGMVDFGQIQAKLAVCGEVVVAAIDLGDGDSDAFARLDVRCLS